MVQRSAKPAATTFLARYRAAVSINYDLAAGQTAIAIGTANKEFSGWIDVPNCLGRDPALGQRHLDIRAHEVCNILGSEGFDQMLMRYDNLGRLDRLAIL